MTMATFKDYLITEADKASPKDKKGGSKESKIFNPQRFVPKMEKVLDQLIKATADEKEMTHELILLEMLSIFKEVLVERLEPYAEKPGYSERKDKVGDSAETVASISAQVEETLMKAFGKDYRRGVGRFMAMIVGPILNEIARVGLAKIPAVLDSKRFDSKAKDSFGYLMRYVQNSIIIPNAEDAEVAQKILVKWGAEARASQRKERPLSKAQRLKVIATAVNKVQDTE